MGGAIGGILNLESLGNLGELVGGIAVVASLAYLAIQIRQNTKTTRAEMLQQHTLALQQLLIDLGTSAEASRAFNAGLRSWSNLSEEQKVQFSLIMAGTFQGFDGILHQYRSGLLEEDLWQSYANRVRWYLARKGVREWWRSGVHIWTSEPFVALVNDILAELGEKDSERE